MAAIFSIILLLCAVAGTVLRIKRLPNWIIPLVAMVIYLVFYNYSSVELKHFLSYLTKPLLFVLAIVPMAKLLDDYGFFKIVTKLVYRNRHSDLKLYLVSILTVATMNLDAGVSLQTPLAMDTIDIQVKENKNYNRMGILYQPVIAALLASSFLPISNLTNLIVISAANLSVIDFLIYLGIPSLIGLFVSWQFYKIRFHKVNSNIKSEELSNSEKRLLIIGSVFLAVCLVGFILGDKIGLYPYMVALIGNLVLLLIPLVFREHLRYSGLSSSFKTLIKSMPYGTCIIAVALSVLSFGFSNYFKIEKFFVGPGLITLVQVIIISMILANLLGNLSTVLVFAPFLDHISKASLLSIIFAVNMGPCLLMSGSLAALLWLKQVRDRNYGVNLKSYIENMAPICLPALAVSEVLLQLLIRI